jgi:hypothetical protein
LKAICLGCVLDWVLCGDRNGGSWKRGNEEKIATLPGSEIMEEAFQQVVKMRRYR